MGYEFFVYAAVDILQKRTNGIVDLAESPLCVEKNLSSPIVQPQSCILDTAILKGVEISPHAKRIKRADKDFLYFTNFYRGVQEKHAEK